MEGTTLYNAMDVVNNKLIDVMADANLRPLTQTVIPVYRCPSDTVGDLMPDVDPVDGYDFHFDGNGTPNATFSPASASYKGNVGYWDISAPSDTTVPNNGPLYNNSGVRFAYITDGTSNTIAVGEAAGGTMGPTVWVGNRNPGGSGHLGANFVLFRVSRPINDTSNDIDDGRHEAAGSLHSGGAQFVFADGAVHFLSENIEYNNTGTGAFNPNDNAARDEAQTSVTSPASLGLYQKLGIMNDGQFATPP